jgi:hypothetical protein
MRGAIAIGAFIVLTSSVAHGQVTLQNDGFTDGASAGFQGGFHPAEIGASRFVAPEAGRQLQKIQLLFGGATTTRTVTLRVWDDTNGTNAPGPELFSGDFELTGSNEAMHEIDITSSNVLVTQQFRVGIEFQHMGYPAIARDDDGTIAANRNFILAEGIGWIQSSTAGLTGDWIIRAEISGGGGPGTPDAAPGPGTPDAAPSSGEDCDGNSDCPVGEYCDTAEGACTFDCRDDSDCGDNTCNSLGQCVEGGGGGGGCSTDGGGSAGQAAVLLALGVLVLGIRRRA